MNEQGCYSYSTIVLEWEGECKRFTVLDGGLNVNFDPPLSFESLKQVPEQAPMQTVNMGHQSLK